MENQLNQKELKKRIEDSYTDDKGLKEIREQGELNGDGRTCFAYCRRILQLLDQDKKSIVDLLHEQTNRFNTVCE